MDNPDVDGWYIGAHEDGHGVETSFLRFHQESEKTVLFLWGGGCRVLCGTAPGRIIEVLDSCLSLLMAIQIHPLPWLTYPEYLLEGDEQVVEAFFWPTHPSRAGAVPVRVTL